MRRRARSTPSGASSNASARALAEQNQALRQRESAVAEREGRLAKRVNEKLDDRLRQARQEIDSVVAKLKERSDTLIEQAAARAQRATISTGEAGAARAEAAAAVNRIIDGLRQPGGPPAPAAGSGLPVTLGARVTVAGMGLEGVVVALDGNRAEVDVRGKRMRAKVADLRVIGAAVSPAASTRQGSVRVHVDLQPREGLPSELERDWLHGGAGHRPRGQAPRRRARDRRARDPHRARARHRQPCGAASRSSSRTTRSC